MVEDARSGLKRTTQVQGHTMSKWLGMPVRD